MDKISELRIDKKIFLEKIDFNKLNLYLEYFNNKKLSQRISKLIMYIKNA